MGRKLDALAAVLRCRRAHDGALQLHPQRHAESYLLGTILGGIDQIGGLGRILGLVLALTTLQVVASDLNMLGSTHGSPRRCGAAP